MKNAERGIVSSYDMKKPLNKAVYILMCIVVAVMCISMLYPIATALFNGLKANVEVNSFPPHFLPQEWHFDNYKKGWGFIDLPLYLRNTMLIFAGNMVVTVIVIGFAAFSLSRLDWPYRKAVYYFFLATLFIPPTTYIIPNFINLRDLHLMNTFWAFWLPAGANAFYLLLLKSFFDGINQELFEAFRVDGASEPRVFWQLAFPLSMPIFATLAIFVFATSWNDWFWPSMVMGGEHYPLATAIKKFVIDARRLDLNIRFAILTMIMIPPIVIFLVFQRFIVRGLHLGGVKG
ncbi:carbohydrate ABC transporter permease [Cohnella sp. JJ-181]|uniref:carbohydrate ABC transporter permease n=1 Tax=Cohnella rhizoplanae TaxID=2974897 RepID=UPI0022FF5AFA|nr:carbohydrate ABC transporter permease [Cohnella sp. JJ-181]CAI6083462.1 Diacetylchitobiose uptake system permease protein NgcG [Cohnella sp. JJ-181]